jgi:hypothetical protein
MREINVHMPCTRYARILNLSLEDFHLLLLASLLAHLGGTSPDPVAQPEDGARSEDGLDGV